MRKLTRSRPPSGTSLWSNTTRLADLQWQVGAGVHEVGDRSEILVRLRIRLRLRDEPVCGSATNGRPAGEPQVAVVDVLTQLRARVPG